ncbi:MAG: DegT/DnrJ/EryC1/StrS family aminotransferase [Desulfotomaculales bacterium]
MLWARKNPLRCQSGTAVLHAAALTLGGYPGDKAIIAPPMSLVAAANCIVFQGGTPAFAGMDVDPVTPSGFAPELRHIPGSRSRRWLLLRLRTSTDQTIFSLYQALKLGTFNRRWCRE